MSKKHDQDVLGKLDKVADSLERTTAELSGAVTQQQLDVIRERIAAVETDQKSLNSGMEVIVKRTAVHADEADDGIEALIESYNTLERDFSGMRALTITSFLLSSITLIAVIILSI